MEKPESSPISEKTSVVPSGNHFNVGSANLPLKYTIISQASSFAPKVIHFAQL
jgi:hypothetical protein